ncbi:hypothetical protein MLD38_011865 [Melastoma candidum]|uniref:Uncharacterized protein n=1 Tax=Melastoma candidum TaxID=119954 RepID=A0ACB9R4E9_9MYRT|nr:hypothetical protein MLD38_011865 [Melastoma candidum]
MPESFMETRTQIGRPVPMPPQLPQAIRPDPEQVLQPTSPSVHPEQRQLTQPVPLQVRHLWKGPVMVFWSMTVFTRAAPAKALRPVASGVSANGPISLTKFLFLICGKLGKYAD